MDVLITCKYEEDPIKNRGAGVFTTLYINFSDAQGQITLELVAVSDLAEFRTRPRCYVCSRYLQVKKI